jgi:predicted nucleotidyltransferase component of viral defense system
MQRFLTHSLDTQRVAMEQTAIQKGLPFLTVEKDFWVCWTLEQLFNLPEIGSHLTFKGGTSLSKVWGLIQRFSEDIDLVVDKAWLGFGGEDSPAAAPSNTQRRRRNDALRSACSATVCGPLREALEDAIKRAVPMDREWDLSVDGLDPDRETLLFHYPRMTKGSLDYLKPVVKIELGARADKDPAQVGRVHPEVSVFFPQLFDGPEIPLRAIDPERTFLEKVTLLHEENHRPLEGAQREQKLARHYYDVAQLVQAGIGRNAMLRPGLFEEVVAHRRAYFERGWGHYGTMTRGTLKLVPDESRIKAWAKDYNAMQREMFYGTPPSWEEVLTSVEAWESEFNAS